MTLRALTKLGALEAEELKAKGVAGDAESARFYLLWTLWRKLASFKGYSLKARLQVLSAFNKELAVSWQTTSS